MNMIKIVSLFNVLVFLISCSGENSPDERFYFDEKKFMSEWNIWKSQDIKDYSFTLKGKLPYWNYAKVILMSILMYDYEVEIAIKNGSMHSFEYIGRNPYQDGSNESIFEPEYTSISDMYQKIYDSIKDCEREWKEKETSDNGCFLSKRYEIEYDPKYHYITRFEPIITAASGCDWDTTEHEVIVSDFSITQSAE